MVVPVACLAVFTSPFTGYVRIAVFAVLAIIYFLVVYYFKDKVKKCISNILEYIESIDDKKLLLILTVSMIVIKGIYTLFFNYDATVDGDIKIYNDIANTIISSKSLHTDAISHLYGVALHFVVFKLLNIPLHIGIFLTFFIGTLVNYLSFKQIIGKAKSFLLIMFYVLMPSSGLISFCPTHELFVYMYMSIFLYAYCCFVRENELKKLISISIVMWITTVLTCLVNPGGYILYVIMILSIVLSNIKWQKKIIIGLVLLLSILSSNIISNILEVNEWNTAMNTYTILIHGSNPYSLGEQVDGYPLKQMRMFIYDNTMDFSREGFLYAGRNVLINQYIYLLSHPVTLLKLICNKIYILWSGVHYPLELANHHHALSGVMYYVLLVINTLMFLFINTLGNLKRKNTNDEIDISTYKLALLGIGAVTMLSIVANKYALYATAYIYLIAMYRVDLKK